MDVWCHGIVSLLLVMMMFGVNSLVMAETKITMNAPVNPVKLGGMLSLYCKVKELEGTHTIAISKERGHDYKLLSMEDKIQNDEDTRIFLAVRRLADNSKVYFLSVIDVQKEDEGLYKCKLIRKNPFEEIRAHPVSVNITYIPDENPECSSMQRSKSFTAGDVLNWNCTSEEGFPTVTLTWKRSNSGEVLRSTVRREKGLVISELSRILYATDDQAIFICKLSSSAFPDLKSQKSCHIGPISVEPNPLFTGKPKETIAYDDDTDNINFVNSKVDFPTLATTLDKTQCGDYCSNLTAPVIHWIIATIAAGALAIIFLITGIVMSIKLCNITSSGKTSTHTMQRRFPQNDDTYAELDSKQDDNRVYMMLDRSQIPEMQPLNPNLDREGNYTRTPTATKEISLPTQCV